jgi:hypothetical protein
MNWDALGAVAELLAATGVIVSLVYLASQIRYSREQMMQNTRSIEAQVSWAHWNAVYNIYHARVENPDLMALFQTMRSWGRDQLVALKDEFDIEFQRARYIVGSEVGFWQTRFYTQTDPEERAWLTKHIAINGDCPMYLFYAETLPEGMYRTEFHEFLLPTLREAT